MGGKSTISLQELRETEWDNEFELKMRNRLVVGAYRYGRLRSTGKPQYDRVASCLKRLKAYMETGNRECLVDVAGLCLVEFVEGDHPKAHFRSVDDGEHTPVRNQGGKR